ncbi:ABC-2 family transporter [Barrientosiimonas humi]|uniref:ABC-2 family transporter n=1 Tax=Barrientosiimonas humi TaxID=999931 RepID=A0A542XAN1_9MICO|nr:ABC transporter permease subunit [Barrientosiimonas humi]TQL32888.1 ABC-2 family transporter [Barrientosiimonas humi]CAG7572878.1 hypothetical protein BH39T_PBIAJDOK_01502 [Barrientosiimonas humi]
MSTAADTRTTRPEPRPVVALPSRLDDVPATGVPFARLVKVELRKATDTRAGRWLLGLIGLVTLIALVAVLFVGSPSDDKNFGTFLTTTFLPQNIFLPIVGILVVTAEWSQRTGLVTFSLEPRRGRVGFAKLVAAIVLGLATVALGAVLAAGTTFAGQLIRGTDPSWSIGWQTVLGIVVGQIVAVAMGVAFGMLLQNTPAAIVAYLVLPMLWSILGAAVSWLSTAGEWLDTSRTLQPLYEAQMQGDDWPKLFVSIAVWVVLPLVLGMIRLRRSEVK